MSEVVPEIEVYQDPANWVYFDLNGAARIIFSFSARIMGYALKNVSTSVTATADIYDSTDAVGADPVFPLTFAASESIGDWFGSSGILFKNGLYVNVTSGEVKGSVFYRHVRL